MILLFKEVESWIYIIWKYIFKLAILKLSLHSLVDIGLALDWLKIKFDMAK